MKRFIILAVLSILTSLCFGQLTKEHKSQQTSNYKPPLSKTLPTNTTTKKTQSTSTTAQTTTPKPATPVNKVVSNGNGYTITVNGVTFKMVYVQGGTFTMGALSNDYGAFDWEKPAHSVKLSSFSIGETEVTQALWQAVMGSVPTYSGGWETQYGKGSNYPAYRVSWNDCQTFINKLNSLTGKNFRLPTEAEWEYAARGGNKSRGYKYSGSNSIDDVAWYCSSTSHPVKQKQPNELGIYDMSGNVLEWCEDRYGNDYYSVSPSNNPKGPSSGSYRVNRGGCWNEFDARGCRSSSRGSFDPDYRYYFLGLRLALSE